jgi:hypothetical protein
MVARGQVEAQKDFVPKKAKIKIDEEINSYLSNLFQDVNRLIKFNENYIKENKLEIETDIEYGKLFPLLDSVYDRFGNADLGFKTFMLKSIKEEIDALKKIQTKHKSIYHKKEVEYSEKFILFLKEHIQNIEINLKDKDFKIVLVNKFKYVFSKAISQQQNSILNLINIKCYYFDKLIWMNVNRSKRIKDSYPDLEKFKKINLKVYLEYYLSKINVFSMKDPVWKDFLEETLEKLK